jgi:hypothetical protein
MFLIPYNPLRSRDSDGEFMTNMTGSDIREDSLQTHGLEVFRSVAIECFLSLNISAFLLSSYALVSSAFISLRVWVNVLVVIVMGGYLVVLIYRRDRIGWVYLFCVGLGSAIALRHV